MSEILIRCPQCNVELNAATSIIGSKVSCPNCSCTFIVQENCHSAKNDHKEGDTKKTLPFLWKWLATCCLIAILSLAGIVFFIVKMQFHNFREVSQNIKTILFSNPKKASPLSKDQLEILKTQPGVAELKIKKPTTPTKIVVKLELMNSYWNGYSDKEAFYYAFNVYLVKNAEVAHKTSLFLGSGYVPRNSKQGKMLFDKLKDDEMHIATITIEYDYHSKGDWRAFAITDVLELK